MTDKPGWGRPHLCWDELASSVDLGEMKIERCTCGKVRQVVIVHLPPEERQP